MSRRIFVSWVHGVGAEGRRRGYITQGYLILPSDGNKENMRRQWKCQWSQRDKWSAWRNSLLAWGLGPVNPSTGSRRGIKFWFLAHFEPLKAFGAAFERIMGMISSYKNDEILNCSEILVVRGRAYVYYIVFSKVIQADICDNWFDIGRLIKVWLESEK